MGDAADLFIDGTLDAETGELIDGTSPGYPRTRRPNLAPKKKTQTELGPIPSGKVKCPTCHKLVKEVGLTDHIRDAHRVGPKNVGGVQ